MGCDIHQINIMIDAKTGEAYAIEGDTHDGDLYKSNYVDEFIPGRSYSLFAILAGVRGDEFQITGSCRVGIPDELSEDLKKYCEDPDYAMHSFTWYYLADLLSELKWTKQKIKIFLQAMANRDPAFVSGGDIDEYRSIMISVNRWIRILKNTRQKLKDEGREEDFKSSKIFFAFDS